MCRVPMQLELLAEMWKKSKKLPQTLDELFTHALAEVLDRDRWAEEGHGDYPDLLVQVAYGMLTEKRPYDPGTHELPQALLEELVGRKLLNQRGKVMEFRHDKVRAYLASLHFRIRWRTLLADSGTTVDSNWDPMLEFHLANESDADTAETLLYHATREGFGNR